MKDTYRMVARSDAPVITNDKWTTGPRCIVGCSGSKVQGLLDF